MRLIVFSSVLAFTVISASASAQDFDTRHYIYIEANASVSAKADKSTISISISERADTSQAAIDAAVEKSTQLLQAIEGIGVAAAAVETSTFEFEKVYIIAKDKDGNPVAYFPDPDRDQFDGYRATNNMTVDVSDVAQIGTIVSLAAGLGAEVNSLSFSSTREDDLTLQAKQKAAESALQKAQLYVDTLGASLGDILAVKEGTGYNTETMEYPDYGDSAADLGVLPGTQPPVPISFPTLDFSASMAVKWEVEGPR